MKKLLLMNLVLGTLMLTGCLNNSTPVDTTNNSTPVDTTNNSSPVVDQAQDLPDTNTQDLQSQTGDIENQTGDVAQVPVEPEVQTPVQNQDTQASVDQAAPITDAEMTEFTLADIATHGIKESCWLAVSGYVYDVTEYVTKHPGGAAIVEGCGKDATELFNTRPMGSGTPHSQNAKELLKNYLIGKVKK